VVTICDQRGGTKRGGIRVNISAHSFSHVHHAGPWRGGDTGDKGTGPGALAGSRGAREDQIMRIKWGPAKANHALQKSSRK
jgi:hypothetical protein